jgi:hypothetical protein
MGNTPKRMIPVGLKYGINADMPRPYPTSTSHQRQQTRLEVRSALLGREVTPKSGGDRDADNPQ